MRNAIFSAEDVEVQNVIHSLRSCVSCSMPGAAMCECVQPSYHGASSEVVRSVACGGICAPIISIAAIPLLEVSGRVYGKSAIEDFDSFHKYVRNETLGYLRYILTDVPPKPTEIACKTIIDFTNFRQIQFHRIFEVVTSDHSDEGMMP